MRHLLTRTVLLAALVLSACSRSTASLDDFDVAVYTPAYASGFEILGARGHSARLLKIRTPWQGADDVETMLFIARNGEQPPAGFEGQVLEGDAARIICMSSSHVAMLNAAGAVSAVVGVSGVNFVSNQYVAAHRDAIIETGHEGSVDYERIVAQDPDIVLLFGLNGASPMEGKLRELGIPFVYIGEYLEQDPLGKAEWVVAVAEIAGCRERGEAFFAAIPEHYEALKRQVADRKAEAPAVMLNTPYGDSWFMAPSGSCIARLIADAGGRYLYTKNDTNRSLPIDTEEAALLTAGADVWLHAQAPTLEALRRRLPKFADARCVATGRVYDNDRRTNARGGNDYWESGVVRPDLVLRDLIGIFYPDLSDGELLYYRRLE